MIKTSVTTAVCVTLFISLILPILLYIIYGIKNKGKGVWTAWLLGAAGFFVPQILIRLPIVSLLSLNQGFLSFAMEHYVLYCLLLALSAGLFEAAGRYAVAKLMRRPSSVGLTFERGVAAGLGHGGIEAILIVGMTYINNLAYIFMIQSGSFDQIVEQTAQMGVDTSSLLQVKETLVNSGPAIFYMAGYERLLTMVLHIALSLLMCYFVWKKKDLPGIAVCTLLHGTVDFVAPLINGMAAGYLGAGLSMSAAYILIYGFLTLTAALSVAGILYLKKRWASLTPAPK